LRGFRGWGPTRSQGVRDVYLDQVLLSCPVSSVGTPRFEAPGLRAGRVAQARVAPLPPNTACRDPGRFRTGLTLPLDSEVVRQYLTPVKTSISTKGQIVLPAEFRRRDEISAGQEFRIERLDRGEYRLVRIEPPANEGLVAWLLACPEKDFFVAIESESTATL